MLESRRRQQQDRFLKSLQGGRAHPRTACGVVTLCCSPPALLATLTFGRSPSSPDSRLCSRHPVASVRFRRCSDGPHAPPAGRSASGAGWVRVRVGLGRARERWTRTRLQCCTQLLVMVLQLRGCCTRASQDEHVPRRFCMVPRRVLLSRRQPRQSTEGGCRGRRQLARPCGHQFRPSLSGAACSRCGSLLISGG
jgi:hypothetical protein